MYDCAYRYFSSLRHIITGAPGSRYRLEQNQCSCDSVLTIILRNLYIVLQYSMSASVSYHDMNTIMQHCYNSDTHHTLHGQCHNATHHITSYPGLPPRLYHAAIFSPWLRDKSLGGKPGYEATLHTWTMLQYGIHHTWTMLRWYSPYMENPWKGMTPAARYQVYRYIIMYTQWNILQRLKNNIAHTIRRIDSFELWHTNIACTMDKR